MLPGCPGATYLMSYSLTSINLSSPVIDDGGDPRGAPTGAPKDAQGVRRTPTTHVTASHDAGKGRIRTRLIAPTDNRRRIVLNRPAVPGVPASRARGRVRGRSRRGRGRARKCHRPATTATTDTVTAGKPAAAKQFRAPSVRTRTAVSYTHLTLPTKRIV